MTTHTEKTKKNIGSHLKDNGMNIVEYNDFL